MPRKKVKLPEPDFVERTVGVFYLDAKGGVKSGGYQSSMEATESYKKKMKSRKK